MGIGHDFVKFPELTDAQMALYYFESPHRQIFESFDCKVVKVHDGDTITVRWAQRNFDFPIRFSNIAAPEMSEPGGAEAQSWLEKRVLGATVTIEVNPRNRVEKFGRLLGRVLHGGVDVGEEEIASGISSTWEGRKENKLPTSRMMIPELELG